MKSFIIFVATVLVSRMMMNAIEFEILYMNRNGLLRVSSFDLGLWYMHVPIVAKGRRKLGGVHVGYKICACGEPVAEWGILLNFNVASRYRKMPK